MLVTKVIHATIIQVLPIGNSDEVTYLLPDGNSYTTFTRPRVYSTFDSIPVKVVVQNGVIIENHPLEELTC